MIGNLWHDLVFGWRKLLRSGVSGIAAIVALALAIGANATIFSIVDGVLLAPLSFPEPERLVFLEESSLQMASAGASYPNFRDWRERSTAFEHLGTFRHASFNLAGAEEPERVAALQATHDLLLALGVQPQLGRLFGPEEDRPSAERTALLSHDLWQRRFGGDAEILGRTLELDGLSYTILGVLPADFRPPFAEESEIWVPIELWGDQRFLQSRSRRYSYVTVGRLKKDSSLARAREEMKRIASQLAEEYPDTNAGYTIVVTPLLERWVGELRPALEMLLAAGVLVLLAAWANVGNVVLTQALKRRHELASRAAIGATPRRLAGQQFVESILLCFVGGVAGLVLSYWGLRLLLPWLPDDLPRLGAVGIDGRVLAFTVFVTLFLALLLGALPIFRRARLDLAMVLREGGGGASEGRTGRIARRLLVTVQVAAMVVLLVGTALLLRSLAELADRSPGFDPEDLVSVRVSLPPASYGSSAEQRTFFRRTVEKIAAVPGIESTAAVAPLPLSGSSATSSFVAEEQPAPTPGNRRRTELLRIEGDYFNTLGIPLLEGRTFDARDHPTAPPVAIVDESFARAVWPGQPATGQRVKLDNNPDAPTPWIEVVGVVGHVKHAGVQNDARIQLYVPFSQRPQGNAFLVARSAIPPAAVLEATRGKVLELDPRQPVYAGATLRQYLAQGRAPQRSALLLLGVFASVALILAVVGIYGLVSHTVRRREREIAIRMSLGALPAEVRRDLVGEALRWAIAGVFLGGLGAFVLTFSLRSLTVPSSGEDLWIYLGAAVVATLVALMASLLPALRVSRIVPAEILRHA